MCPHLVVLFSLCGGPAEMIEKPYVGVARETCTFTFWYPERVHFSGHRCKIDGIYLGEAQLIDKLFGSE